MYSHQDTRSVLNTDHFQTSNEYMEQWLALRKNFLQDILDREARPTNNICPKCLIRPWKVRCKDCLYRHTFCVECCQQVHDDNPFHKIEVWRENHFAPAWLWQTGVAIHLGHGGNKCPSNDVHVPSGELESDPLPSFNYLNQPSEFDNADDEVDDIPDEYTWVDSGRPPRQYDCVGGSVVVVVHTNAVHHVKIHQCSCPNAPPPVQQYLQMGLYPLTYKHVETVFTFQLLDDHLLSNLECQTSAHHYYSKLRRMTNPIFPNSVLVR